jgi:hypothetical protein
VEIVSSGYGLSSESVGVTAQEGLQGSYDAPGTVVERGVRVPLAAEVQNERGETDGTDERCVNAGDDVSKIDIAHKNTGEERNSTGTVIITRNDDTGAATTNEDSSPNKTDSLDTVYNANRSTQMSSDCDDFIVNPDETTTESLAESPKHTATKTPSRLGIGFNSVAWLSGIGNKELAEKAEREQARKAQATAAQAAKEKAKDEKLRLKHMAWARKEVEKGDTSFQMRYYATYGPVYKAEQVKHFGMILNQEEDMKNRARKKAAAELELRKQELARQYETRRCQGEHELERPTGEEDAASLFEEALALAPPFQGHHAYKLNQEHQDGDQDDEDGENGHLSLEEALALTPPLQVVEHEHEHEQQDETHGRDTSIYSSTQALAITPPPPTRTAPPPPPPPPSTPLPTNPSTTFSLPLLSTIASLTTSISTAALNVATALHIPLPTPKLEYAPDIHSLFNTHGTDPHDRFAKPPGGMPWSWCLSPAPSSFPHYWREDLASLSALEYEMESARSLARAVTDGLIADCSEAPRDVEAWRRECRAMRCFLGEKREAEERVRRRVGGGESGCGCWV